MLLIGFVCGPPFLNMSPNKKLFFGVFGITSAVYIAFINIIFKIFIFDIKKAIVIKQASSISLTALEHLILLGFFQQAVVILAFFIITVFVIYYFYKLHK